MPISSSSATLRPWRELVGAWPPYSSYSRPYTLSETSHRISLNLNHFRSNYALLSLLTLFLSLLWHPLSLIAFLALSATWHLLYFSREQPLTVLRRPVDDRIVMLGLGLVTVVVLVLCGVWVNVVVSAAAAAAAVGLHAAFRVPEDSFMDEEEAANGGLLSVVGGSPPARTRSTFASA